MGTIILLGIIIIIFLVFTTNHSFIKRKFKRNNVIVFGYKGTGKDVIFQKVIALRKNEQYCAYPQTYGYNGSVRTMYEYNISPNVYENFIKGRLIQLEYPSFYKKQDYYISDGGVILPSHHDSMLKKQYPSLPIVYALSRQFGFSIHINTQALSRVWKLLREQADTYFKSLYTVNFGFGLLTRVRYFQEYQSAEQNLLPFKATFGSGNSGRALKKQYTATNGEVKDFFIFTWARQLHFDSFYYRKVVFTIGSLLKVYTIKQMETKEHYKQYKKKLKELKKKSS